MYQAVDMQSLFSGALGITHCRYGSLFAFWNWSATAARYHSDGSELQENRGTQTGPWFCLVSEAVEEDDCCGVSWVGWW